ncbi:HDIG domain-containing metalloprotein [Oceanispirochaeta sp.]|jgi:putative nucleotidyltransferase with HDIG domain|uniref:HDIG domain-containing metalloprotein n=1 Tax=Oceanispirochaeta sp. TaxID=2035350 RepID=UPI002612FFFB|nr:HDIG domain-containing metalloprotein [Oceanispirochaeta sp.]MDA3955258.1 HDIG domain-containing protein [Oceanispirochaeta sp.]
MQLTRDKALTLFKEFNQSESLYTHALSVEAVMRYAAGQRGHDPDFWGIVGLIHDLDYEKYPEKHCLKAAEILRERDWPEEVIHGVVSHGWGICSEVEPVHEMEKVLFAIDELTGLITATVLVRPSKSILDLEVKSVKKKWKTKGFSAGVDRSIIEKGAALLEMETADLIAMTIEGMKTAAAEIGLAGIE